MHSTDLGLITPVSFSISKQKSIKQQTKKVRIHSINDPYSNLLNPDLHLINSFMAPVLIKSPFIEEKQTPNH